MLILVATIAAAATLTGAVTEAGPTARAASVCADYPNQAAAQAAADTTDANSDGIYCSSLPCPCAGPADDTQAGETPSSAPEPAEKPKCTKPDAIQEIGFSKTKYPNIQKHFLAAVEDGWPQILAINRPYADARRNRLLQDYETREGFDRDEYPPAVGRGKYRKALMRGTKPRGWKASVDYVPSSENQSHGSTLGIKLRRFCNGTRFRYRFY